MTADHDVDLAGAYVLDALSPAERESFERHLTTCDTCRAEVALLRPVVDALPLAVEQHEPSPELRRRLLSAVDSEEQTKPREDSEPARAVPAIALPVPSPRPEARRPWQWLLRPQGLAALAAAAVIVALGAWNIDLQRQVNRQSHDLSFQQQVTAALASGATVSYLPGTPAAHAASAALVQPRGGAHAYLIVRGLPAPSSGDVYQAWLLHSATATPSSAGVFAVSGTSARAVRLSLSARGYSIAAVTREHGAKGSPAPRGPKVLLGTLRMGRA